MPKKSYHKSGKSCRVTFELPAEIKAGTVNVVGDFNNWDSQATPMTPRKDGRFSVTITLETGREYRFRYLIDGERWENDWEADGYIPNDFGTEDSVIRV